MGKSAVLFLSLFLSPGLCVCVSTLCICEMVHTELSCFVMSKCLCQFRKGSAHIEVLLHVYLGSILGVIRVVFRWKGKPCNTVIKLDNGHTTVSVDQFCTYYIPLLESFIGTSGRLQQ